MKSWSADNPKAELMAQKRAALVAAAERAFLESGYAGASVNRIAEDAGVSIKTLYRHFDNKDDLFSAVMQAACDRSNPPGQNGMPGWFALPPAKGFVAAGEDYLRHVLAEDELALYRVVTRDAHRFPELGKRYREDVSEKRTAVFAAYLTQWRAKEKWPAFDARETAEIFAGFLKAHLFDDALHGLHKPSQAEIAAQARKAAARLLTLLRNG